MDFSLLSQNVIIVIGCPQVWWVSLGLKCLFPCVYVCLCCVSEHVFSLGILFFLLFFLKLGFLLYQIVMRINKNKIRDFQDFYSE